MNKAFVKTILSVFFCTMLFLLSSAQEYWTEEYSQKIQDQAKKENKSIMLFFTGSDWCPACRSFESDVLKSKEFEAYAKKELLCIRVDFPRLADQTPAQQEQNRKLLDHLQPEKISFPAVVLLDPQGKKLGKIEGNMPTAQFILLLEQIKNLPPVFQAARDGDREQLEKLFAQGVDPSVSTPAPAISLLSYAIRENASDETIELILKAGAKKKIDEITGAGFNALCYALVYGRASTVDILLKNGASPQIDNKSGRQPLILAIRSGNLKKVQFLLNAGCQVNVCCDTKTGSPLHVAVKGGDRDIIRALLEKGANPNAVDKEGNAPLHYAVIMRDQAAIWLLLKAKADPNLKNQEGKSSLDLAKKMPWIVKLLQSK